MTARFPEPLEGGGVASQNCSYNPRKRVLTSAGNGLWRNREIILSEDAATPPSVLPGHVFLTEPLGRCRDRAPSAAHGLVVFTNSRWSRVLPCSSRKIPGQWSKPPPGVRLQPVTARGAAAMRRWGRGAGWVARREASFPHRRDPAPEGGLHG